MFAANFAGAKRLAGIMKSVPPTHPLVSLVAKPEALSQRLRPPQAFPVLDGTSIILLPFSSTEAKGLIEKYLIVHELTHATDSGIATDLTRFSIVAFNAVFLSFLLFLSGLNVAFAIVSFLFVLKATSFFFFRTGAETTLDEFYTDVEALGWFSKKERIEILSKLHSHFELSSKIAQSQRRKSSLRFRAENIERLLRHVTKHDELIYPSDFKSGPHVFRSFARIAGRIKGSLWPAVYSAAAILSAVTTDSLNAQSLLPSIFLYCAFALFAKTLLLIWLFSIKCALNESIGSISGQSKIR